MSMLTTRRKTTIVAISVATALALGACGSGGTKVNDASEGLLMWTLEVQTDRFATQRNLLDNFTEDTGIKVDLVAVEEDAFTQQLAAAALSGKMPDVIGSVSLSQVRSLDAEEYLNTDIPAKVIETLGEETWIENALTLTRDGETQLSVPSDSWTQILVYRTDLFEAAGLEAPTSYESLLAAAEALTGNGKFGITLATDPTGNFTQQTFEALALGNNCQLVDDEGNVSLDSAECATSFDLYTTLAQDYSPAGTQDVASTRDSYFAGQSAMIMWSTFLLDELAGLRNDATPTCDECSTGTWLAENSGIVPLVTGPDAGDNAASYGEITSFVATEAAAVDESTQLIEYLLSDGYIEWFSMAPEGKFPVRRGTTENPEEYADAWGQLEAGVDTLMPLGDVYDAETIETLTMASQYLENWGLKQGKGKLIGQIAANLPLAQVLSDAGSGSIDGAQAQAEAQKKIQELAEGN